MVLCVLSIQLYCRDVGRPPSLGGSFVYFVTFHEKRAAKTMDGDPLCSPDTESCVSG